jgi:DNA-binding MarR family transcriptional regulator
MSSDDPDVTDRLGYLLKHAQLKLHELTSAALEPFGLDGRELAVLTVLGSGEPASQQEAARRLSIDRTTMVAFIDSLEDRELVERRAHADDRRKNVVELTHAGRVALRHATKASEEAEREFLAPLTKAAAERFRDALHTLVVG